MDNYFHPIVYNSCNYLSMLALKLIHVSKRGPKSLQGQWWCNLEGWEKRSCIKSHRKTLQNANFGMHCTCKVQSSTKKNTWRFVSYYFTRVYLGKSAKVIHSLKYSTSNALFKSNFTNLLWVIMLYLCKQSIKPAQTMHHLNWNLPLGEQLCYQVLKSNEGCTKAAAGVSL